MEKQGKKTFVQSIRDAQPAIIELFTLCAPYAAAALPAALSGGNVASYIMPSDSGLWGGIVGFVAGASLEMIGIAVGWVLVNIISSTRSVPISKNWKLWAALYAGVHYVAANLSANVGIVAFGSNPATLGVATGALSTMSVPAVIVGVLWALEINVAAVDDKKQAAATDANRRAYEQGTERIKTQNEHEINVMRERMAHEERLAKIARGIDPDAVVNQESIDTVNPSIAELIAELTRQGKSKREIAVELTAEGVQGKEIAAALGVDPAQVSRWKKAQSGGQNG